MMQALQPRPSLLLLGPAFLMDAMVPPAIQDTAHIPSTHAEINNNDGNTLSVSRGNATPSIGQSISQNARRLQLRNAGFRAALLPTRKLTPPRQPGIEVPFSRLDNIENTNPGYTKARHSSPLNTISPVTVLQEIRNSSQRRSGPSSPLGELFGFADDEKENINASNHISAMASRTGSIKAPKNRKSVRRASSFQSVKYIEYLESELGAATKKLESIQPPEPGNIQSAKIRKLEKRTSELSQHLEDWEKNFEERVNDAVFERVHGESSLRLQILTLEQAVAHKETHMAELSKELEDTKVRLMEAGTIESTLTRRIDILTELLAKSPTRASFSVSAGDSLMPPKTMKPMMQRIATSPTKSYHRSVDLDRRKSYMDGVTSPVTRFAATNNMESSKIGMDTQDLDENSRLVSGVFTSYSSQASSSRPTSMFSINSLSTWTSADEKPLARARKSRRFAPGTTGLKPLLLSVGTGISNQGTSIETPQRIQARHPHEDDLYWESSEDLMSPTPSRPGLQDPYSWTYHSSALEERKSLVTADVDDDTFVNSTNHVDAGPSYSRSPTPKLAPDSTGKTCHNTSPLPARRSLFHELNTRQQPFCDVFEDPNLVQDHPFSSEAVEVCRQSADLATERQYDTTSRLANDLDHHAVSGFLTASGRSNTSQHISSRQHVSISSQTNWLPINNPLAFIQNIIAILSKKTLVFAREILLQSYSQTSARFLRVARRILSTISMPQQSKEFPVFPYTPRSLSEEPSVIASADYFGGTDSISTWKHTSPDGLGSGRLENQPGLLKSRSQPGSASVTTLNGCCFCRREAAEIQRQTLLIKLAVILASAAGYSLLRRPTSAING